MRTFKQFLSEQEKQDIVMFLRKNCKAACEDAVEANNFLWRGFEGLRDGMDFSSPEQGESGYTIVGDIIFPRGNRAPRDTPNWAHKEIDNFFEQEFERRLRSTSVFCTTSKSVAHAFGQPHIILPIGNYDVYWSEKVVDLTSDLFPDLNPGEGSGFVGGERYWAKKKIPLTEVTREMELYVLKEFLKQADYKKGPNVTAMKEKSREMMVQCGNYFALPLTRTIEGTYSAADIEAWVYEAQS